MSFLVDFALALPGDSGFYLLEAVAWACLAVMVYAGLEIDSMLKK